MKRLVIATALLFSASVSASAGTVDVQAIQSYLHAIVQKENRYDADHTVMMKTFFSVGDGKTYSNHYLRDLMSNCENDLLNIEMMEAPPLHNATAQDFINQAQTENRAYAANADRIIHQFFSIGPNYSITRYMRDASIEDAKGSSYTHRAITDTMGALAAEGLSRSQVMTVMRDSISRP